MDYSYEERVICDLSDIMNIETTLNEKTCYCGHGRRHSEVEVYCPQCAWWYHASCVRKHVSVMAPFSTNYNFLCKNCSADNFEHFERKEAGIVQLCHTALANLLYINSKATDRREYYQIDTDIIAFIDSHWDALTTITKRPVSTWKRYVHDALIKNRNLFIPSNSAYLKSSSNLNEDIPMFFTLCSQYLNTISSQSFASFSMNYLSIIAPQESSKKTTYKRVQGTDSTTLKNRVKKEHPVKLNFDGFPVEHTFNREAYFWHYAEPDPFAPFQSDFQDCLEGTSNTPIPAFLYRAWLPTRVHLSYADRAHQLTVTDNLMEVTGSKGYSMVRATHGVSEGTWYWECKFTSHPHGTHARLGFSRLFSTTQAPCGYDELSYSWRSRNGTLFHNSNGKHFSEAFKEGDVLGFLIHIPPFDQPPSQSLKSKPLMRYRGSYYFEEIVDIKKLKESLRPLAGSYIEFFKNGVSAGIGFRNIFEGKYFPAVSLFKTATITANFGPDFDFCPLTRTEYKPWSDVVYSTNVESTMTDSVFFSENMDKISDSL